MCRRTRWRANRISKYEREKRWLGLETIPAIGIYRDKEHLFGTTWIRSKSWKSFKKSKERSAEK